MLDLEIIPERSLGCDTWEFVLGKTIFMFLTYVSVLRSISILLAYAILNIAPIGYLGCNQERFYIDFV